VTSTIAQSILDAGADNLLAVKDNQPTLHAEIRKLFRHRAGGRSRQGRDILDCNL
jgi:hypothetical protein